MIPKRPEEISGQLDLNEIDVKCHWINSLLVNADQLTQWLLKALLSDQLNPTLITVPQNLSQS